MVMEIGTVPRVPSPIATPVAAPTVVVGIISPTKPPWAHTPAPRPTGIGIGCPHVIPVPGIRPGGSYPSIVVRNVDIPVVIVEEINIGIEGIAYRHHKLGVVEPTNTQGILIVRSRSVETVQVVTVIAILVDNIILDIIFLLIGCQLIEGHLRSRTASTIVLVDIEELFVGSHHQRLLHNRIRSCPDGGSLRSFLLCLLLYNRILIIRIIIISCFPIFIIINIYRSRVGGK